MNSRVAQRTFVLAALAVSFFVTAPLARASGATWTQIPGTASINTANGWAAITATADGTKLAAIDSYNDRNYFYISTDGGATWVQHTELGAHYWGDVAYSGDGSLLVLTNYDSGDIYTSENDGATWTAHAVPGDNAWYGGLAVSYNGNRIAANDYYGTKYIFTSDDRGSTWTQRTSAGQRDWWSIALSDDGLKIAAGVGIGGYIYTSTDGGATWTERTGAGAGNWYNIGSSADGSKLATISNSGYIYTSTDGGATWTQRTNAGQRDWTIITSSVDGTKLVAADSGNGAGGYIYTSTDGGATWIQQTNAGQRFWYDRAASSADGSKVFFGDFGLHGYIYTATLATSSALSISSSVSSDNRSATVSWSSDQPTDGQLNWGSTQHYENTGSYSSSPATSHTASLSGLTSCSTYYYQAVSSTTWPLRSTTSGSFKTGDCGGGVVIGSGPDAPSAAGLPGYVAPRPQIRYPDGHVEYLDGLGTTTLPTVHAVIPAAPGTSSFTSSQSNAIINLLTAFGVDSSTLSAIKKILGL